MRRSSPSQREQHIGLTDAELMFGRVSGKAFPDQPRHVQQPRHHRHGFDILEVRPGDTPLRHQLIQVVMVFVGHRGTGSNSLEVNRVTQIPQ